MQVDEGLRVAFAALRAPGDDASKLSILSALRINLLNDAAKFPLLKHLMPFICELEVCIFTFCLVHLHNSRSTRGRV
jgi:hypothetical protein